MDTQTSALLSQPWFVITIVVISLWSAIWKGFALWRSARDDSKVWFVLLLILNTAGILDIVYIFAISPMRKKLRANA